MDNYSIVWWEAPEVSGHVKGKRRPFAVVDGFLVPLTRTRRKLRWHSTVNFRGLSSDACCEQAYSLVPGMRLKETGEGLNDDEIEAIKAALAAAMSLADVIDAKPVRYRGERAVLLGKHGGTCLIRQGERVFPVDTRQVWF